MNELVDYFNRFYQIVLKDLIGDPLVHSQWLYFQSMMRQSPLDKNRVDLYLGILDNEHQKKLQHPVVHSQNSLYSHDNRTRLVRSKDEEASIGEVKFQKQISEKWKGQMDSFDRSAGEPYHIRKLSNLEGNTNRNQKLGSDSKNQLPRRTQNSLTLGTPKPQSTTIYTASYALRPKVTEFQQPRSIKQQVKKDRHRRLCEISSKIIKIFEGNARIRG